MKNEISQNSNELIQKYMNTEELSETGEFFQTVIYNKDDAKPGAGMAYLNELIIKKMVNGEWKRQYSTGMITWRDAYCASNDNWDLRFWSSVVIEETEDSVTYGVKTGAGNVKIYHFSSKEMNSPFLVVSFIKKNYGKDPFISEAEKGINEVLRDHQHPHPLFKLTRIVEKVIDAEKRVAIWTLFEQIDTDRNTEEAEGWLGDQFRYSIWKMNEGKLPVQLYEDHAYVRRWTINVNTGTRGNDCSLKGLKLEGATIKVLHLIGNIDEPTTEELTFNL